MTVRICRALRWQCCKFMQQTKFGKSGIAVIMVMVLVIREYAAGCWNGASETESALDDAGHACVHACMHMAACTAEISHSTAVQAPPSCTCAEVQSASVSGLCVQVQPELHGMLPVEEGQFLGMQCMAMRWPNRLKQAAAVCNSLTLINKSQVVGDAADKQAFKAVEARFVVSHTGFWLAAVRQLHVTPASKPGSRY
jgi:hypothetical protein